MAYIATRPHGLGLFQPGVPSECDTYGKWILNPDCWPYSPSAWAQMGQFAQQATTIPAPALPSAPTPEQLATVPPAQLPGTLAEQAATTTQAQNVQAFSTMTPVLDTTGDGSTPTGLSTSAMIALGLGAGVLLLAFSGSRGRRR